MNKYLFLLILALPLGFVACNNDDDDDNDGLTNQEEYAFGLIPVLELLLPRRPDNLSADEEALAKADPLFDWVIYLLVPVLPLYLRDKVALTTAERAAAAAR